MALLYFLEPSILHEASFRCCISSVEEPCRINIALVDYRSRVWVVSITTSEDAMCTLMNKWVIQALLPTHFNLQLILSVALNPT